MKQYNSYEQNKKNMEICDKEATRVTNLMLFEEPIINQKNMSPREVYEKQKVWMHRYMLEYIKAQNKLVNVEVVNLLEQVPKTYQTSSFYN